MQNVSHKGRISNIIVFLTVQRIRRNIKTFSIVRCSFSWLYHKFFNSLKNRSRSCLRVFKGQCVITTVGLWINSEKKIFFTNTQHWLQPGTYVSFFLVWWQLPLFLFILSFSYIHNHIHTVHSFSSIRRGLSPFLHCLFRSEGKTSLGCRAGIWTRACHTAGQRTTSWATLHPCCFLRYRILDTV